MKSILLLAGALVAVSSVAFAQPAPESETSNSNAAGLGASTHGRAVNRAAQPASPNRASQGPESETSNSNAAGMGASTHGRGHRSN